MSSRTDEKGGGGQKHVRAIVFERVGRRIRSVVVSSLVVGYTAPAPFKTPNPALHPTVNQSKQAPMSHLTIMKRLQLFFAVIAVSAVGFVVLPTPARAGPMFPLAPACDQHGFAGSFSLRQTNGYGVSFSSRGTVAAGGAVATGNSGERLEEKSPAVSRVAASTSPSVGTAVPPGITQAISVKTAPGTTV